jgi:hypothetical protein
MMKCAKYYLQKSSVDRFEVFRNDGEDLYRRIGVFYLFDLSFQEACLKRNIDFYTNYLDEVPSAS